MKWLKKYWWYIVISFSSSFVGGIICITITNKNIGSLADWVSGIGSLLAIAFAYWQIHIQTKEYEEDKKEKISREILANRPFFSFIQLFYLNKGKDHIWTLVEDRRDVKINNLFSESTDTYNVFKNGICAYNFKNVSQAVATNVVLKIEYQSEANGKVLKTDYCNIGTCVIGKEQVIILPHSIMNEPSTYSVCPKSVYLYFSTIDDRVYRQSWINKFDKFDGLYIERIEQVDIKEVPIEEMPIKGTSSRSDIK